MASSDFTFSEDIGTARYEDDVHSVLAQIERRGLPAAPIAFFGSSSFRLWHNMAVDLNSLDVVNLGFGGGTNASGIHYLDKLLTPLKPAKVVLYFGENDIANDGLSASTIFANFKDLHAQIAKRLPGVPIFCLSTKQSPRRWVYSDVVEEFNQLIVSFCDEHPELTYVNVTDVLLGENGRPIGGYYVNDGVHLNAIGYAKWAEVLHSVPGLLS